MPCPPPGDLPDPGTEPVPCVSSIAGGFFTTEPPGKPLKSGVEHAGLIAGPLDIKSQAGEAGTAMGQQCPPGGALPGLQGGALPGLQEPRAGPRAQMAWQLLGFPGAGCLFSFLFFKPHFMGTGAL